MDAREVVLQFAHVEGARRKDIEQLHQLNNDAVNYGASPADKAKIARTLEGWTDFIRSQETNYSELLQHLAWPGES